jgi:hypothetical protein
VDDKITRNHNESERGFVADIARYLNPKSPWLYLLSILYRGATITAMLIRLQATQQAA